MRLPLPPTVLAHWSALAPRERNLALGAAAVVAAALLWWVGVGPAFGTLRSAQAQQQSLEAQLQRMKSLQAEAQALQSQPRLGHDDAVRALEASVRERLGAGAQLSVTGERASVTLRGTPADVLAAWLTQARINARAVPAEAHLTRSPGAPAAGAALAAWDGTLVLGLPAR